MILTKLEKFFELFFLFLEINVIPKIQNYVETIFLSLTGAFIHIAG